mmetsp:Transcript_60440/g.166016  ORF Transcript_60440/g.166016 Transcript_60440/m.166016 type:complete len:301 (+) Transcript_60440:451-1353(+)
MADLRDFGSAFEELVRQLGAAGLFPPTRDAPPHASSSRGCATSHGTVPADPLHPADSQYVTFDALDVGPLAGPVACEPPGSMGATGGNTSVLEGEQPNFRWSQGEVLGAGSFGEVMMALNQDTGSLMAVKRVNLAAQSEADALTDDSAVEQVQAEVMVMKALDHPNIVRYINAQHIGTTLYIFMEYMPGGSISKIMKRFGGCLQVDVLRQYLRQVLEGLEYLHSHQVIHRDLKCANLLVDQHGTVKLAVRQTSPALEEMWILLLLSVLFGSGPHFKSSLSTLIPRLAAERTSGALIGSAA